MKNQNTKSWIYFVSFAIFMTAVILTFAEPAWAIQQHMTEQQANKKIDNAYSKDSSNSKITGMVSGKQIAGVAMILIGIIMMVVMTLWGTVIAVNSSMAGVCTVPIANPALCIGLMIVAVLLVVAGIFLLAKGKEVKSGERDDKDTGNTLDNGVEKQATTNQKTNSVSTTTT